MPGHNRPGTPLAVAAAVLVAAACQSESGTVDDAGPTEGVVSAGSGPM
jgi:hypothetical protein